MSDDDKFGYGRMSLVEMRESIANLNKEIMKLESDKKDYTGGMNSTIKELRGRLRDAVDHLKQKEVESMQQRLDEEATKLLEKAAQSE